MSREGKVGEVLGKAEDLEKKYDWVKAAALYEQVSRVVGRNDFLRKGEIQERIGYCFCRAAFQADSQQEFKQKSGQAVEAYRKATEFYGKMSEREKTPKMLRCEAMTTYTGYWLRSETPEKKRLINECWRLTKKALKGLDETDSALEYGETYNQLSSSADHRYYFESSFQFREELIREAVQYGERAIILLSKVSAPHELARAYVKTAMYLSVLAWYFASDMGEKDVYYKKGLGYWQKANELSEETAFLELLSMPGEGLDWNTDEMLVQFGKALDYARKTKDKYLVGTALNWLNYATYWTSPSIEDPDKRKEVNEKVLQYAKDATHQFSPISYVNPFSVNWSEAPYATYYLRLASWETDLGKKRDLLEKARVECAAAVKRAEDVGYPDVIMSMHGYLGQSLVSLAKTETNLEEKRNLLESADEHLKEEMKLREQLERFNYWNLGVSWRRLANLRAELSQLETDDEKKKNMLEEAVLYKERGLRLCSKYSSYIEKKGDLCNIGVLGLGQHIHGEMLERLYGLTHNDEVQIKALKAFKDSAESFQKVNLVSRVAESWWKMARSYEALGEHLKAAENFNLASDNYKSAGEKIPQLKDFYHDYARYMEAWSEIERARHHHKKQEYGKAKESYEKSANMHKSTERWNYLAPNYSAWARLEEAEDLSRKEQTEEARELFQQAAELFSEAQKSINDKLEKIEASDQKEMATGLATASKIRKEYCLGRVTLEEAKILDRQGDHAASSRKYGSASEKFQKAGEAMEHESDRRELKPIVCLCRAWQLMTRAEAEASPDLYLEASQLFEEAKNLSGNEKARMLALGHSRFCRALEAGARFEDIRDTTLYSAATRHLESASNYYVRAGFKTASEYTKATQRLFDAYVHMDNAKKETDPEKKARYYMMTKKFLQASAGFYMKAKHPHASEEVRRLLESVEEEQEFAVSLTKVLHAPTAVSTTTSFSTPAPTHEQAVGLERFEHADIQANLILRAREIRVGEDLTLEIELVNAGKAPALLIKVEKVVPEDFQVKEVPEIYRIEDRFLNMKGRRLAPLKTEEIRLVLRPANKGTFILRPRIMYLDEAGKYKSHEPEPVTITVKELGVSGWIKGQK